MRLPIHAALLCVGLAAESLIEDGDFERPDLAFATSDAPGVWVIRNHGADDAAIAATDEDGARCLSYRNTGQGSHNIHVDQLVPLKRDTVYVVEARMKGDGTLRPLLAVQTKDWATLETVVCPASTEWQSIRLFFNSYGSDVVRLEWFPGATGQLYSGVAGESWLDDVTMRRVPNPSSALKRSFALKRPRPADEMDLSAQRPGPIGRPDPLRRITARDGVLYYADGSEVALWGVNIQTPLSWEYNGRLQHAGVPLTAEALKQVTDTNLDEMPYLGVGVIRMHLLPSDFTGPNGEMVDTVWLDVLDHVMAQCRERGIYVYLTLMNEMNTRFLADSFVAGHEREEWIFDPALARKSLNYVGAFLSRTNRYTGVRYADDPTVAVVEIINEPHYPKLADLRSEEHLRPSLAAFDAWRATRAPGLPPGPLYAAYRYQVVLSFLNGMCRTVRDSGCPAPVVWNLNWPRMVNGHEDVYQAAADSAIDGVSFCCYPGQSDTKHPFWANPVDLSDRNYLPYLKRCYRDYSYLRWMLGTRFEKKARMAYEFETMYNHTAHLYPAMAALFRSLGAQLAPMWQYTLTPVAEVRAGSHYLNAVCTPRKAVSFRIASRVFTSTPRYTPFVTETDTSARGPSWWLSQDRNLSVWSGGGAYIHSDHSTDVGNLPPSGELSVLAGCGESPTAAYDGSGMYVLTVDGDAAELELFPDVSYTYPPWQRNNQRPPPRLCKLDADTPHTFELRLDGWTSGVTVVRVEEGIATPVAMDGPGTRFTCRPGRYRLTRPPVR